MHTNLWVMGAISLWLTGCVPSLQPLYTDKDVVFDRTLLGTWSQTNREDRWVFVAEGTNAYKLVHTDKQGTAEFTAHLVNVQGQRYLDLFPKDVGAKLNELAICTLIPGHLFLWVKDVGAELQLALISGQKLDKLLNAQPKLVLHNRLNDGLVLTAPTADLQQLFARLGPDALFNPPTRLLKEQYVVLQQWLAALDKEDYANYTNCLHSNARKIPEHGTREAMHFWARQISRLKKDGFEGVFKLVPFTGQSRFPPGSMLAYPVVKGAALKEHLVLMQEQDEWKIVQIF